jgi:glycosyltransferase involved in cell wall biosynthesis
MIFGCHVGPSAKSSTARSIYYFTDSGEIGGAERALLSLLEHIDRRIWRPTLLYNPSANVASFVDRAHELGAEVRAVPPLPLGFAGARGMPSLARQLRGERPTVFHAHLSWPLAAKYPLAAAVLARVPAVVATVHLFPALTVNRSTYFQERLLATGVGRYIAVSRDIAARLYAAFGWPARKIETIHNGVAVERFQGGQDPQLRRALTGGESVPVVLTVARLAQQKGLDVLLRAAVDVPDARFAIAGDGPERVQLETMAQSLGVAGRVAFLGHRTDVPDLLAAADLFVLPSLYEGSSLAILEAMAAGRAVVSSSIRGTDELIVDGESGCLVQPGDAEGLAGALRAVLGDDATRARLGSAARDRVVAKFSAAVATERVTHVYEDLLKRTKRGRA